MPDSSDKRLLILGGTAEAAALAERAVARFGRRLAVTTSLAGRIAPKRAPAGEVRIGGFGGAAGLARYLRQAAIDVVIDATHPFAATMSAHAVAACEEANVARLALVRPPWQPRPGDDWRRVADMAAAARALPRLGRRAFLTTGPGSAKAFAGVAGVWFLVRVLEAPRLPLPLARCAVVVGRPPFTVEDERRLLAEHRIEVLVTKDSGGEATAAKLAAARLSGVPVLMVSRPSPPPGALAATVEEALDWLARRL